MKMNLMSKVTYLLLVIGGLNWGLIGLFDYNLVESIFSSGLARVIYGAVGLAALYGVYSIVRMKAKNGKGSSA